MKAGDLRHRLTFEVKATPGVQDTAGEDITPWVEVATVWAAIDAVSGNVFVEQAMWAGQVTHRIRIRRRTDLTTAMRAREISASRTFKLLGILAANVPDQVAVMVQEVV